MLDSGFTWVLRLLPLLLLPGILPGLAVAVLILGLPRARRFRQPLRYRFGIVATAVALLLMASFRTYATLVAKRATPELELPLIILIFVVIGGLLGGGLTAIVQANNTPTDDLWDRIFPAGINRPPASTADNKSQRRLEGRQRGDA